MDFIDNTIDVKWLDDEITLFDIDKNGYYAYLRSGDRLDIMHAFNFQPPIDNPLDFFSFMFVESLQGFFLLRQRILENRPLPWYTYMQFIPEKTTVFFQQAWQFSISVKEKLDSMNTAEN